MDNPLTFLLIILALFFGLWLVGGGPSRAISFSGPYITPIADVNPDQTGYGPKINPNITVSLPGSGSASVGTKTKTDTSTAVSPSTAKTTIIPVASNYAGKVSITKTTVASSQNPNGTYVELLLSSHDASPVTLRDWKLVSKTQSGTVLIKNGSSSSVTLSPNQSALIVTSFLASESHDTITLLDGSGASVSTVTY